MVTNGLCRGWIGLRADIDALPIQDGKNVDYASRVPAGCVTPAGHDVRTAILLGAGMVLSRLRDLDLLTRERPADLSSRRKRPARAEPSAPHRGRGAARPDRDLRPAFATRGLTLARSPEGRGPITSSRRPGPTSSERQRWATPLGRSSPKMSSGPLGALATLDAALTPVSPNRSTRGGVSLM